MVWNDLKHTTNVKKAKPQKGNKASLIIDACEYATN
jgi:hypothetical protein